jgi:Flp pilus assembly protein TadD
MSDWVDAERHAELAHQYYEAGQWDKAAEELRQALSVNPDQAEWQFGLGMTLDALQRYEEAIDAYEEVLRLRGEDVDTLLHVGVDQVRVGRPGRAVESLERAAEADPSSEAPYCHRVAAYTQLEDHDNAELMFYLARDYSDECPLCYDHIAHSLAMRDKMDRAAWCWQRVATLDPQYPGVQVNLARVHWYGGHTQRARQYYLEQLRFDPGDVETMLELGNMLVAMERPGEASEKFRRVLEVEPGIVEAHVRLGQLSLQTDNVDTAAKRFERARRLNRQHPGVHLGLAQVAYARGQLSRARQQLQLELKSEGQGIDQILELTRLLVELDQPQQAIDLVNPWLDEPDTSPMLRDEDRAAALVCRGVAGLQVGSGERGIADLRFAAQLDRENVLPLENLALAYARRGRLNRATVCLREARALQPGEPHLRQLHYRIRYHRLKRTLEHWLPVLAKLTRLTAARIRRLFARLNARGKAGIQRLRAVR